jgi:hypothetical protein
MKEGHFFCPDTHFLVACCFYDDQEIELLDQRETKLRKCYKMIRETGNTITFECQRWDYHNKVRNTERFLHKVVLLAKRISKSKGEFEKKIFSEMKNNPKWDRYRVYIRAKLPHFSEFVMTLDETSFIDLFHEELDHYLICFAEQTELTQVSLSSKSPQVLDEYEKLRRFGEKLNQSRGSVTWPQDRDLKLLASCKVYCNEFLPEGMLSMVTEDRALKRFAERVIENIPESKLAVLSADDLIALYAK